MDVLRHLRNVVRAKRRRRSTGSAGQANLVRGGTRARHGGSNSLRLLNADNATRAKKGLSDDYRPSRVKVVVGSHPNSRKPKRTKGPVTPLRPSSPATYVSEAMRGMRVFDSDGDSSILTALIRRTENEIDRARLINWCRLFADLRWNPNRRALRGRRLSHPVAIDAAEFRLATPGPIRGRYVSGAAISPQVVTPQKWTPCRVCGHPSLPGEDTCHHHDSG